VRELESGSAAEDVCRSRETLLIEYEVETTRIEVGLARTLRTVETRLGVMRDWSREVGEGPLTPDGSGGRRLAFTPFIEWTADHLPEKRMGVLGVDLILIGFTLQSIQYWLALLDVSVR
jgi:hypothetical protein